MGQGCREVKVTDMILAADALLWDSRCPFSFVRLVRGTVGLGVSFTQSARRTCL